jgi:hypothetical protein
VVMPSPVKGHPATELNSRMSTITPPATLHHRSRLAKRAALIARPIATVSTTQKANSALGHMLENQSLGDSGTSKNIASTIIQARLAGPDHLLTRASIVPIQSHTVRLKLLQTKFGLTGFDGEFLAHCGRRKFSVTLVVIGTGCLPTTCGLKRHCFTAAMEACTSTGDPFTTSVSSTVPSALI